MARLAFGAAVLTLLAGGNIVEAAGLARSTEELALRGRRQPLRLYGSPGPRCAIVSSGDGGWVGLAPDVAERLAQQGFFVIGFDSRAYLSSFTHGASTLTEADVPRDYLALVARAEQAGARRPLLVGVSEGAGLSVLAATDEAVQSRVGGALALGLPDHNELGWRFRDSIIYLTKKTPDEPLFSVQTFVDRVAPVPLAIFQATHDEFVPPEETRAIVAAAREPRRVWLIEAGNHRFADARPQLWRCLEEAIAWISVAGTVGPRGR